MRRISCASAFALALLFAAGGSAMADPGATSSCAGIGSSWAGQRGTREDVAHNTQAYAELIGVTPGSLVLMASRDHAGSFEACFGFPP
jgi:hypothetical protein